MTELASWQTTTTTTTATLTTDYGIQLVKIRQQWEDTACTVYLTPDEIRALAAALEEP